MKNILNCINNSRRLRETPVVDDDFPQVLSELDSSLRRVSALSSRINFPTVVCLCGSTKFKDEFIKQNFIKTMRGEIVLTVGFFRHSDETYKCSDEEKIALDILHKEKILLSDYIFVINVGGYIGKSTQTEIDFAEKNNIPVIYLEIKSDVQLENNDI